MMTERILGDLVEFNKVAVKRKKSGEIRYEICRVNDAIGYFMGLQDDERITGIIVGRRTLMSYDVEWMDEGIYACPIRGSGQKAWLVSWHLDRKPVYVLEEHIST